MLIETETILVVDDHPVVLEGISLVLKDVRPNAEILTALNAKDALRQTSNSIDIDWIFIDVNLPGISGLELARKLRSNKILSNIIILSSEIRPSIIEEALKLKVNGILSKAFDRKTFVRCFNSVDNGNVFLTQEHSNELNYYRQSVLLEKQHVEDNISTRQFEALLMIAKGYSNKEISDNMMITESTVKSHVSSLMTLLNADNRTHCVSEARRLKLI